MGSRNGGGAPTMIRRRQSDFKMSFNLALRSLLTTCSKEASELLFVQSLTNGATDHIPVITTLHGSIKVGTALDTVGQLVEEQCLDPFFSDKTNVMDAVHNLSTAKKAEIQYLRNLLERVELHKNKEVTGMKDVEAGPGEICITKLVLRRM
ncbi:hypothetical protein ES332_A08G175700v1 [Gossypium tomentosum]|uniref:Uncharacterized protein n=1 Tax=Gossypium tomentosum TaxID=34277 RepID=A0A5D2PJA9_GOSTO|nr:hypothetical protein ES332_A08G175700v1 [Gossypium tomentosum]